MKDFLSRFDFSQKELVDLTFNILFTIIVYVITRTILAVVSSYTGKAIEKAKSMEDDERGKRIITVMTLTRSIARYVLYFIAFGIVLNQFGFGSLISNVLVTAGIGTLAISFGAQSVIADVVTGFLMMFEKQYAVGDFVKIGDYEGTVTAVSMRVTYLNCKGKKVIIPNGKISTVINYDSQFTMFDIVVPTAYEANTTEVMMVIDDVIKSYYKAHKEDFFDEPVVLGVTNFNDSSVDITVRGKCVDLKHWETERALRLAIKERFDKDGISIPYSQLVVHAEK